MSSFSQTLLTAFHRYVIRVSYGRTAVERGVKRNDALLIFINVYERAARVKTALMCGRPDDATSTLQR